MSLPRITLTLMILILTVGAAFGANADWVLVWEDDFDRTEVGDEWLSSRATSVSIEDGRLLLLGGGGTLLTSRTFKPDVRIEFEAEAWPGAVPCDLSATIGANPSHGYGYLLAFGGQANRVNQLLGSGVRQVDSNPPFPIESGKRYHIVAQLEGKRFTYTVNGVKLLDAESTDLAAGPGFDRVGLVTWNGMLVDYFKVYERATPHPDTLDYPTRLPECALYRDGRELKIRAGQETPALSSAVEAFNKGEFDQALRLFKSIGGTIGLIGQAYVIGDLYYEEDLEFHRGSFTKDFLQLADQFAKAVKANPRDEVLAAYARAAKCLPQLIMERSGMTDAIRLVALGPENNPFYHKARLYEARYLYWNGKEGGNQAVIKKASDWMAELKQTWPDNTVLKQYTGEPVPWAEELNADTENHPAWAANLREAYARQIRIMERFFTERQSERGDLGGGWGDDVELMRTWMQIASISTGSTTVRDGIEHLADGIWTYECKDGYAKDIGDVEHSAEPSADAFPTMLLLKYGDPLWVERNMRSSKTVKELFMGIDKNGHPRFKSSEFGAAGVATHISAGGDTGYNARAMKHLIWQAWWGCPEAKDWFVRWCDGWREATMARIDDKIPGFVPASIWYPSGEIYPPGWKTWWDDKLNYYGCPGMGGMIMDSMLCAYYLTGDQKFIKPFQLQMDLATRGPLVYSGTPPSEEWQKTTMYDAADPQKTSLYKWMTGERVYDEYTMRFGDPAQAYRVNYDLETFLKSFERTARNQRHNLELQTTEVLSTDRAALSGALTVFGAYTGSVTGLRDASTPTFAVTYDAPDTNFAALVTESSPKRIRIWLYSFRDTDIRIGLKLWQLTPGNYVLNQGELMDGERPFQNRYGWIEPRTVRIVHRATGPTVTIPPGKVWVVDLRLDEPIRVPETAPDMAIGKQDLVWTSSGLEVTVHNIGNADARPFVVALQKRDGQTWKTLSEQTIRSLPMPRNFEPSTASVTFGVDRKSLTGEHRISVDREDKIFELCETNNVCEVSVR